MSEQQMSSAFGAMVRQVVGGPSSVDQQGGDLPVSGHFASLVNPAAVVERQGVMAGTLSRNFTQKGWEGFDMDTNRDVIDIEKYRTLISKSLKESGLKVAEIYDLLSQGVKEKISLKKFKLLHCPSQNNRQNIPKELYDAVAKVCQGHVSRNASEDSTPPQITLTDFVPTLPPAPSRR